MVSLDVAPPVVKSVVDTVAVHAPSVGPRLSVTVTVPSCDVSVDVPVAAEPRSCDDGTLMLSEPAEMVKVVVLVAA